MKKLLFIIDTFHPEYASTGQLMTELCQHLQNEFDITVIVGIPKYGISQAKKYDKGTFFFEEFENIKIVRVKTPKVNKKSKISRIKYISGHFINAFRATFRVDKPDLIYVISQPPILGGFLGRLAKLFRGGKLIYNIQDFNPEQAEAVGYSKMSIVNTLARAVDNHSIRKSDQIIVVGRDMYDRLLNRVKKIDIKRVCIINNWIHEGHIRPYKIRCGKENNIYEEKYGISDKLTIMYSGNIGLYYDLENIIKVIGEFKFYKDLQFIFVGDGVHRLTLETFCKENNMQNVLFYDYVPKEELQCSLNAADIHFVTNQKGIKGVSVPSKIYGILGVGRPVLGILEQGSEAAMIIEEAKCGKYVEPQDYKGIRELIQWFYDHREESKVMGRDGRTYLEKNLRMEMSLNKYKDVLLNL